MTLWKSESDGAHRVSGMLAVVLVLNLFSMVAAPNAAVAQERPALTYFALGDSYASGHGLEADPGAAGSGKYGPGDGRNCRRSPNAYPYQVARALGEAYTVDFGPEHHLACSGATAGPYTMASNHDTYHIDKSISAQAAEVYRFLDERDSAGSSDPVLVTITIGANDIGLSDWLTRWHVYFRGSTATGFYQWLNEKTSSITSSLTPVIDNLLAHDNVYIILTDYPRIFPEGWRDRGTCNDIAFSLNCEDAMKQVLANLNLVMTDQFSRANQPNRLRVVSLSESYSSHPASGWTAACVAQISNPESTWFQGDCAHPNMLGAQAIADVVVERALTVLPQPVTAQPTLQETWTASVQVMMCDAPPGSGTAMNCHAEGGIMVNISLASGEFMGSCTLGDPQPTPLGGAISTCSVSAMPFNADFVATQDPSTIPAGYEPSEDSISLRVDDLIPGGGDQATFTFYNVRTDASSQVIIPQDGDQAGTTGDSGTGSGAMTGDQGENDQIIVPIVPQDGTQAPVDTSGSVIEDFFIGCDVVEACLSATVTLNTEEGQFVSSCTFPETLDIAPWFCQARDVPRGITVLLTIDGLVPGYEAVQNPIAWDTTNEPDQFGPLGIPAFSLVTTAGGMSSGSTESGEATMLMTFRACPEGFDPDFGDFHADCTIPLDAPDASFVYWGVKFENDPGGMHINDLERQYNGAYVFQARPGRMDITLSYLSPVVRDAYQVIGVDVEAGSDYLVYLVDGETREIFVFYYNE